MPRPHERVDSWRSGCLRRLLVLAVAVPPASAICLDDHKLVRRYEDGSIQLFHLGRDPEERHDLAAAQPEVVAELTRRLDDYLQSIDAAMPRPNPAFGKPR